jgi:hypothetical protein
VLSNIPLNITFRQALRWDNLRFWYNQVARIVNVKLRQSYIKVTKVYLMHIRVAYANYIKVANSHYNPCFFDARWNSSFVSPSRIRTYDQSVNSRPLYH